MSETATKKKEPGMATLVIVLFAICAATALLLGLTNYVTAPFIAANNEKTTQEAMAAVLPANSYDEVEYTGGDAMVQAVYKAGDAGYTGTGGSLRLLAYRHEVMSGEAYEALQDKDANTLYLIYEED